MKVNDIFMEICHIDAIALVQLKRFALLGANLADLEAVDLVRKTVKHDQFSFKRGLLQISDLDAISTATWTSRLSAALLED